MDNIYIRHGNKYSKLERHEIIKTGAMYSYCGSELTEIRNNDIIGDIPASFSDERDFYNPVN